MSMDKLLVSKKDADHHVTQSCMNFVNSIFIMHLFFVEERTNHAMMCIGYGVEDNKGPYWILKNTWGEL